MNDSFEKKVRAAAVAGWWVILIAAGFLTLVWLRSLLGTFSPRNRHNGPPQSGHLAPSLVLNDHSSGKTQNRWKQEWRTRTQDSWATKLN
jgi:hypothetical protein